MRSFEVSGALGSHGGKMRKDGVCRLSVRKIQR